MTHSILRIDASARRDGLVSRELADKIIARFAADGPRIRHPRPLRRPAADRRDWIGANFTPADDRSRRAEGSPCPVRHLVAELQAADVVIGLPIYNFGVPASLKAWIDLVARAGVTFRYTEYGPKGLLEGKRAIVSVASGGTPIGSEIDFATGYIRHVLGFIGITDVEIVKADRRPPASASRASISPAPWS
jgi:FMN-dependent NADH-azoreductase